MSWPRDGILWDPSWMPEWATIAIIVLLAISGIGYVGLLIYMAESIRKS